MVPRQSSTLGRFAGTWSSLGFAASSSHRDRLISDRAALADVFSGRHPDLIASSIRAARIFSKGLCLVPEMASAGSGSRGLGFRRNDGLADRSEAPRLRSPAYTSGP